MTDLSRLSNDELMALRAQAANPLAGMTNEQLLALRAQAAGGDESGGALAQLGYGAIEGAAAIPGMIGDVAGWMDSGIDYVADKFGARRRGERPRPLMPNTQEVLQAIKPVTGEMPAPQSTAGQYARTIGQFGLGALIPGGVARRVIGGVLAPAVASEAAGQATEGTAAEPYARIGAGLAGGVAGAMRLPKVGANARADRAIAELVTPDAAARLDELGPEAFLFEANPTLQHAAAGVVQRPGQASNRLRAAVTERHKGAGERLNRDIRQNFGAPIAPSRVDERIGRAQQKLGPHYRAALDHAAPTNSAAILNVIDQDIGRLAGNPQRALREIREFFFDGNRLKNSAGELLSIRGAIDDMVPRYEGQANATRVITEVRQAVDDAIRQASPDIKSVDARFARLAGQRESLERGQTVLRSGPEATRPTDLAREIAGMDRSQRAALRLGTRADIERILGTTIYDVSTVKRLVQSEGKYNRDKLAMIFGEAEADRVMGAVNREDAFKKSYNDLIANSQTAPRMVAERATRVNDPGNIAPQALGAMAGMAVSGGNPLGAIPGAIAGSGVKNIWERVAAGGQRRLDAALVDRLGAQGPQRDQLIQALQASQQPGGMSLPPEIILRALMAAQGGSVPSRIQAPFGLGVP